VPFPNEDKLSGSVDPRWISEDRTLGRLEGRVSAVEDRVAKVEGSLGAISAKLDEIRRAIDEASGFRGAWHLVVSLAVSASGWVALAVAYLTGSHR
jgi:hypothetical protein